MTYSKYRAKKVTIDGIRFDSKREARRYLTLKSMQDAGEISGLELQKPYLLIPPQKDPDTGKTLERACKYKADFVYKTKDGQEIVEDVKGKRLPEYIIKRKLMLKVHGIRIREV